MTQSISLVAAQLVEPRNRREDEEDQPTETSPTPEAAAAQGFDRQRDRKEQETGDESDEVPAPYAVQCEYRVLYLVTNPDLTGEAIEQIAYWDSTKVAWPYFRADLSSILARADLPQLVLPMLQTLP